MKSIEELIHGLEIVGTSGRLDVQVTGVCYDSRHAEKGSLFVCVPGIVRMGMILFPTLFRAAPLRLSPKPKFQPAFQSALCASGTPAPPLPQYLQISTITRLPGSISLE